MGLREELVELFAWFLGVEKPVVNYGGPGPAEDCALMLLSEVKNPDHYFYLKDGTSIKSLSELERTLKEMDEATFAFHVNKSKNDFALWVREVVRDYGLACKLEKLRARSLQAKALELRVRSLKQNAGLFNPKRIT